MAFVLEIANRFALWLVTTHHRRAARKRAHHPFLSLFPHANFLLAVFKTHPSLGSSRAARPSWRLHRALSTSRQLDLELHGLQRVPGATGQVLSALSERRAEIRGTSAVPCALLPRYWADRFARAGGARVAPVEDEAHVPVRDDEREARLARGAQGGSARGRGTRVGSVGANHDEPRSSLDARTAA